MAVPEAQDGVVSRFARLADERAWRAAGGRGHRREADLCNDAEASIVDERGRECVQADDVDAVQRGDADDVVVRRLVGRLVAARTLRQLHHAMTSDSRTVAYGLCARLMHCC